MRCSIVRCFLPDAQSDVITDLRVFRYDCLAKLTARPNLCIVHDNGVTHNRIFTDRNTAADYRVLNLSVNCLLYTSNPVFLRIQVPTQNAAMLSPIPKNGDINSSCIILLPSRFSFSASDTARASCCMPSLQMSPPYSPRRSRSAAPPSFSGRQNS